MKSLGKYLMILGIITLLIPITGQIYTKYQQQQMYQAYLTNIQQIEASIDTMNQAFAQEIKEDNELMATTLNGIEVIGLMAIPKIDVEILLVEGVSDQALQYAAGHMPGTALPGEVGNCSIAGHRSYTFGKYFNRLDELEPGDEIRITYGTQEYIYEVYETFLVLPTEVTVTEPQGNESVVTLITCHPVINPTHRLIVRGKLVKN